MSRPTRPPKRNNLPARRGPRPGLNLPQTFREVDRAERLAFARELALRSLEPGDGMTGSWFATDQSREFVKHVYRAIFLPTAEGRMALIDWARAGEQESRAVLDEALVEQQSRHEVTAELEYYVMLLASRAIPNKATERGPKENNEALRVDFR